MTKESVIEEAASGIMNTEEIGRKLFLAAGFAGLTGAGYTAAKALYRRHAFHKALSHAVKTYGIDLVSADLGRIDYQVPVWRLTVNHPSVGLKKLTAKLAENTDPYSEATIGEVFRRIVDWARRQA